MSSVPLPAITARLERLDAGTSRDTARQMLDPARADMRQDILMRLAGLSERMKGLRTLAAQRRVADEQQNLIAAIGVLSIMTDEEWVALCHLRSVRPGSFVERFIYMHGRSAREAIEEWMQTGNREENGEAEARSASTLHWQTTVAQWYGSKCVLTGRNTVDVCHILADTIVRKGDKAERFFDKLDLFWPKAKVDQLRQLVRMPEHVRQNLLVLSSCAHEDWSKAKFGLRPQSVDPNRLTLEFVWLASTSCPGEICYSRNPDDTDRLIHQGSSTSTSDVFPIETGDRVVLESSDASRFPLPSFLLLQLQWDMQRIARACGAAEVLASVLPGVPGQAGQGVSNEDEEAGEVILQEATPMFSNFLLDTATELGVLSPASRQCLEPIFIAEDPAEEEEEVESEVYT